LNHGPADPEVDIVGLFDHPNQRPGLQAQIEPASLYAPRKPAPARGLRPALTGWGSLLKSVLDRSLAALLSPVLPASAIVVRLDSKGPILVKQRRYGFNNELIEIYKFRSMHADPGDAAAQRPVSKGDPWVTPVGRFVRKTSIDELPHPFNVLSGQLSPSGRAPMPHGPTPRTRSTSRSSTATSPATG
jgi:lipopolysaccharide/colanic/teichoic acid biosynthesis glycosyltransferase